MTRTVRAICIGIVAGAASCTYHDPESFEIRSPGSPSGIEVTRILDIEPVPTTLPADGISRAVIKATIDPSSIARTISFETSLGTLYAAGKTAGSTGGKLTVEADAQGIATVELQSASQVATAKLTIGVSTAPPVSGPQPTPLIVRTLDVPFVEVNLDQLLTFEAGTLSLPADGFSSTALTATIRAMNADLKQDVTFTSTRGSLTRFKDGPGEPSPIVKADASGAASILLRSDTTVGTARVTAKLASGLERSLFVQFVPINVDDIITLAADASEAPADGATRTRLVATVSPSLPAASRTVTFITTDGDFGSFAAPGNTKMATATADASNRAVVELRSPTIPVRASISAQVASLATARTSIEFTKALPDTVFLSVNNSAVNRAGTNSVRVTVTLLRDVGQVGENTVVTYEARDSSGAMIGAFSDITLARPDPTNARASLSTATFNPDDLAAAGVATITARVGGVNGSITIQLN
jgi:hypothetical protein